MTKPATIYAFSSVTAYITPTEETVVEWRLSDSFRFGDPTSLMFFVEWAPSGGDWTRLNAASPVTNTCLYLDTVKRRCGLKNLIYYRVVAEDGATEYISKPAHTMGVWSDHDRLVARDVLRKEYLRLKQYAAPLGNLIKRRERGKKCTQCADPDIPGEPVSSLCDTCYGTGFVHGYYAGIPMYVSTEQLPASREDVSLPFGNQDTVAKGFRTVAFPRLSAYDIWIQEGSNQRYVFRVVKVEVEVKGVPLVYTGDMRLIPAAHIEYSVPLTPEDDDSSSSEELDGDWRLAATEQNIWN